MLWSVSVDGDERRKHASPLSPWSVSMETQFLTLTHILYVHPSHTVFPAVNMWLRRTSWKTNNVHVDNTGALVWLSKVKASSPKQVELQLVAVHMSEARATIYPAVMQQYNLAVILKLSCSPIMNSSAEAKITTVAGVIWNNHFHEFMLRETHQWAQGQRVQPGVGCWGEGEPRVAGAETTALCLNIIMCPWIKFQHRRCCVVLDV